MSIRFGNAAVLFVAAGFLFGTCSTQPRMEFAKHPPEWSYNASIYEVNVRQYSEEGTFAAFEQHLPRLRKMGVQILWFMPIHPIGEKNRKGTLGSYYAVKDYLAVNSEFGTLEEFKSLVRKIHDMGMFVILDWVANHTAWDNPLTQTHPEWYTKDENGNFLPPVPDWSDVIDLNYDRPGLRRYMIEAMIFWVDEVDVDGFRCDVAEMVPLDFWREAGTELEQVKPVFMLAEGDDPELHEVFDMTYDWRLFRLMGKIAQGEKVADDLMALMLEDRTLYPPDAFRMRFTSNHDENSWNGTVFERLGDGAAAFAVLTATVPGMPLIYSGQEAGLDKRLGFFEKDPIDWRDHEFQELYTKMLNLKKSNQVLWNGERGGIFLQVPTSNDEAVFAFLREKNGDRVLVVLNLSASEQSITFTGSLPSGEFRELFSEQTVALSELQTHTLAPWGYEVFVKQ